LICRIEEENYYENNESGQIQLKLAALSAVGCSGGGVREIIER
jgi:hypothetical protein